MLLIKVINPITALTAQFVGVILRSERERFTEHTIENDDVVGGISKGK